MAQVHELPGQRREYITDGERSALRATWHQDSGFVVISLWRGDTCVATSHMTPKEAGRLATFITGGLADLATEGLTSTPVVTHLEPKVSITTRLRNGITVRRRSVAWSLESIARRLR